MMRWFWRIYWPATLAVAVITIGALFGSTIEERVWPVRGDQSITVIERSVSRVCWAWTFTKLRDVASPNLDAFLAINGEQGGVAAPYDMESGRPWGMTRYAVHPRPEPYTFRMCTGLAPYVRLQDTVTVRQVAFYPGFLRLWELSVPFPDVVSPGVPKAP